MHLTDNSKETSAKQQVLLKYKQQISACVKYSKRRCPDVWTSPRQQTVAFLSILGDSNTATDQRTKSEIQTSGVSTGKPRRSYTGD